MLVVTRRPGVLARVAKEKRDSTDGGRADERVDVCLDYYCRLDSCSSH